MRAYYMGGDVNGRDMKFILRALIFIAVLIAVMLIGCTYTAPSISEPDLIERVTNGHIVCYYKTGPGRGYAKCCDDCPMHNETVGGGK